MAATKELSGPARSPQAKPVNRLGNICLILVALAWLGNAIYAWGAPDGLLKKYSPALVAGAMIAFVILHGSHQWGRRRVASFAVTIFCVGWFFETVSINTGFPFGNYTYGDIMWPFFGHVPVAVMPAYWVMAYVCWSLALLLRRRINGPMDRNFMVGVPVIGAILMVVWDLSMDPLRAIAEQRWHWHDGGSYFGIPLTNFLGWFFVTWFMFQIFAMLVCQAERNAPSRISVDNPKYWLSVPLMYLAFPMEYLLNPVFARALGNANLHSVETISTTVYFEIALVTLLTMVPISLGAMARLHRENTQAVVQQERVVTSQTEG
ncbi:carotenoid biosynthesis protein [Parasphingorhabdus sp.]|uniref:carotenoid biosynthesis protein n=1 Tax=Parasphingorhabdus sp. TaxID=2709688 RepID=UPI0032631792